jgi:hypothetical protein
VTTIGQDPDRQKKILKKSVKQEKRSAKLYNGSRNARSGAGWLRKNDVRSHDFLIENKLTENMKTITIKELDLRELRLRAIAEERVPILQFDLANRNYVILTEDDFFEMIGE